MWLLVLFEGLSGSVMRNHKAKQWIRKRQEIAAGDLVFEPKTLNRKQKNCASQMKDIHNRGTGASIVYYSSRVWTRKEQFAGQSVLKVQIIHTSACSASSSMRGE